MARPVWTGSIAFGLVSVNVKALTAVRSHSVRFHQIDKESGARVGNQKVSKSTGDPIESDEIELGYEVSEGRYVVFDPKEIDELRPSSTRVIEVVDFVALESIDPVFFDRTYWLAPTDEGAEQAYRLLAAAMDESRQVGIGTVVMRNKQYLTAIRPREGALALSTLHFSDEVVDVGTLDDVPTDGSSPSAKEMKLASQIIDALSADWDPAKYHDTFTDELKSMIEAKDRGDDIVAEELPQQESAEIVDLMAALQASVDAATSGSKKPSARANTKKSATKQATPKKSAARKGTAKKRGSAASKRKAPARKSA